MAQPVRQPEPAPAAASAAAAPSNAAAQASEVTPVAPGEAGAVVEQVAIATNDGNVAETITPALSATASTQGEVLTPVSQANDKPPAFDDGMPGSL